MAEFPLSSQCIKITNEFYNNPLSLLFQNPYTPDSKSAADYRNTIKKPMDLSTVKKRIKDKRYSNYQEWAEDMFLIFNNAVLYHEETSLIGGVASYLRKKLHKKVQQLEANNLRNYEAQLISIGNQLSKTIKDAPPDFNVIAKIETSTTASDDFTIERIQRLNGTLEKLVEKGKSNEIIQILRESNTDQPFLENQTIDLAHLGRRALINLENYVKHQESQETN